jgi:rod shape-determining protein MreD
MTVLSWARFAGIAVVALIVQVAVLDQIVVLGAHPDLMITLVGAAGVIAGSARGASMAFVLGLFADLVLPTPYGLSSLTFVLVGFGAGLVRSLPGNRDGRSTEWATSVAAAAVGTLLYAVIGALVGQQGFLGRDAVYAVLVVALGAVVLAVPAVMVMRWIVRGGERAASGFAVPTGGSATR